MTFSGMQSTIQQYFYNLITAKIKTEEDRKISDSGTNLPSITEFRIFVPFYVDNVCAVLLKARNRK